MYEDGEKGGGEGGMDTCAFVYMMKRFRSVLRTVKTGSHPGLNQRPLT